MSGSKRDAQRRSRHGGCCGIAMQRSKSKRKTVRRKVNRWSHEVMQRSDALDLEQGVFTRPTARAIALSLKRSAQRSGRRKSSPFRSAMSMLNFHINRAGHNLSAERRDVLNRAKDELRRAFGKTPSGSKSAPRH